MEQQRATVYVLEVGQQGGQQGTVRTLTPLRGTRAGRNGTPGTAGPAKTIGSKTDSAHTDRRVTELHADILDLINDELDKNIK